MLIFGQQDYAERLKYYFKIIYPQERIGIFIFPTIEQNPMEYTFDFSRYDYELSSFKKDIPIWVAFGSNYRKKAIEYLAGIGFVNIRIYDASLDNELKKQCVKEVFTKQGKTFCVVDEKKSVAVYMAKSIVDKPLQNYPRDLSPHIIPIQVGAALTDKKIADVADNTGDNISDRNRHFSETTALYWMWKNVEADYLGLCHYRRLWKDLEFIAEKLQDDIIDVVLPVPTLCVHSVYEDYMERYIPKVYPTMLDVLHEMSPEYYEASDEIYRGHVFYACNMLIAKRRVLHELCQWMFPIVFEIEKRIGDLLDPYQNRYAGFCTERLITLYFLYNKENWHITHADKIFIE